MTRYFKHIIVRNLSEIDSDSVRANKYVKKVKIKVPGALIIKQNNINVSKM